MKHEQKPFKYTDKEFNEDIANDLGVLKEHVLDEQKPKQDWERLAKEYYNQMIEENKSAVMLQGQVLELIEQLKQSQQQARLDERKKTLKRVWKEWHNDNSLMSFVTWLEAELKHLEQKK